MNFKSVSALAYDPNNDLIYAGTDYPGHGIWKYDGTTWTDTGFEVSEYTDHSVSDLAFDNHRNHLYAAVNYSSGSTYRLWRYNGTTWTMIHDIRPISLVYDPYNRVLYAGQNIGVMKYNGTTWTDTGAPWVAYRAMALDPNSRSLYAAASNLVVQSMGVWKYDGTTWTETGYPVIECQAPWSLAFDSKKNLLYAGTFLEGVWKYDGSTWTNTGGNMAGLWSMALEYNRDHEFIYAAPNALLAQGRGIHRYNGTNWINIGGPLGTRMGLALLYVPGKQHFYAGIKNGGVWRAEVGLSPRITSVSPNPVTRGSTIDIDIDAVNTNFLHGVSRATVSGDGITVNSTRVRTRTRVTANITVDDDAPLIARTVNVITGDETPTPLLGGLRVAPECAPGTAAPLALFGALLGLMSIAGSGRLSRRFRKKK